MNDRAMCACCGGAANPRDEWRYNAEKFVCPGCWNDPNPNFAGCSHGQHAAVNPAAVDIDPDGPTPVIHRLRSELWDARERIRALEAELAARKETFGEFRNETFAEFYARHHHGPHERFPGCSFCDEEAAARKEAKAHDA